MSFSVRRLSKPVFSKGGRNNTGRITTFHRGGGFKKRSRRVDFQRDFFFPSIVRFVEKDPSRTAYLALIVYPNSLLSYIISPEGAYPGMMIFSGPLSVAMRGSFMPLFFVPNGSNVYNISFFLSSFSHFSRAAGSFSKLLAKYTSFNLLKLPSGEHRLVSPNAYGVFGSPSNPEHSEFTFSKAGRARNSGIRPRTRGVATNPVDHPHGGRTQRGRPGRSFSFGSIRFARTSSSRGVSWIVKSRRE